MESLENKWVLCELTQWSKSLLEQLVKVDSSFTIRTEDKFPAGSPKVLIVPYYTPVEIIIFAYMLLKTEYKNIRLLLPKSIMNSPISLFVIQRGLKVISNEEDLRNFVENMLIDNSLVVFFPESGLINEEEFKENHLGLSPFYLVAKNLYEELLLIKKVLESQIENSFNKITWLVSGINYIPSRFRKNPFESLCEVSYEELASGYLDKINVDKTFVDRDSLVEGVALKLTEFDVEGIRKGILELHSLYTPNFERICLYLLSILLPFTYSERQLRNKLLLLWGEVKTKIEGKNLMPLIRVIDKLSSGELSAEWNNLLAFFSDVNLLKIEENGYYRISAGDDIQNIFQRFIEIFRYSPKLELSINSHIRLSKKKYFFIRLVPDIYTSYRLALDFYQKDLEIFEEDYRENFHSEWTKDAEVGKPFFLFVPGAKVGVVLSHGYLSAPMEVRALGEYLYKSGITVYGVRLKGHGTSPLDLAKSKWEEWYESLNRGISTLRCLYDKVYLCGFSAGGCLALYSASRKSESDLAGVISISAPIKLQNYAINLLPTVMTLNYVIKRFGGEGWDLLEHKPENPHINYQKNPLQGLRQLRYLMEETEKILPMIKIPALVIQGSHDTTVNPQSADIIFEQLGSQKKYKLFFNRNVHGIINGPSASEIFSAVRNFVINDTP